MKQDTLQSLALVRRALGILSTASRSEAKELRECEELGAEGCVGIRLGLLGELGNRIGLLLLKLLRQSLLLLRQADLVFLIGLLVLSELLLELEELGLQRGLLEVGGLLVGIDDLEGHELVEGLAAVLGDDVVDLGGVGLAGIISAVSSRVAPGSQAGANLQSSW